MYLSTIKTLCENRRGGMKGLAQEVGMSEQNLHRCVRENRIAAQDLEKIAKILQVSVQVFFDEEVRVATDYTQNGTNSYQVNNSAHVEIKDRRDQRQTQTVEDPVLTEKIKLLEALLTEKDERIADLKERIDELKARC